MWSDLVGRRDLSPLQKCIVGICVLLHILPADNVDEYIRIAKYTTIQCLEVFFLKGVNEIFGDEYLRRPNNNDINRVLQIWKASGFLGMLDSIDCLHWEWNKCSVSW